MGGRRQPEAPGSLAPPGLERQPNIPEQISASSDAKIVWISPRKTSYVADVLTPSLSHTYLLHTFLTRSEPTISELSTNHLVAFDVPATLRFHLELNLLTAVNSIIQMGTHVAIVVQPDLRNKSHRSTWVHAWNHMPHIPFRFQKI